MAVVWVRRRWQERGGKNEGVFKTDDTISYLIKTDNKNMTRFQVELEASGYLPYQYQPHPERFWLSARSIDTKQLSESPFYWICVVKYSSEKIGEEERQENTVRDPLNFPTHVTIEPVKTEVAVDKDRDQNPIQNTAGDPYTDNPVFKRKTLKVIKCWKYFPAYSVPTWHSDYTDKISSSGLLVYGQPYDTGTLIFSPGTIHDPELKFDVYIQKIEWSLEWTPDGWQEKRMSAGFQYLNGGEKKVIKVPFDADEEEQERPSDPQFLTQSGGIATNPDNAALITHEIYEEFDPNSLPMRTA